MMNRRQMLRLARSGLVLSSVASVVPLAAAAPRTPKVRQRRVLAGLLLPLSGTNATLGRAMERSATLAPPPDPKFDAIVAIDTTGTPAGSAAAAQAAMRQGAEILLGPLTAADVRPVIAAAAGKVPVIAFSNDPSLLDSGAFLLGITPSQAVAAIFGYARGRGVKQVAIAAGDDAWSKAAAAAAVRAAAATGLTLVAADASPDAVLLPAGGPRMVALARSLKDQGVQLLGTVQTIAGQAAETAAYDGMWLAGFDPQLFGDFQRNYQAKHGGEPGLIAALAYDAATVARTLAKGGVVNREALLAGEFQGVSGSLRFRSDGSCLRQFAILVANSGGNKMVGRSVAA